MNCFIQLTGIPEIRFAHSFRADEYRNTLQPSGEGRTFIEVTYVAEGELEYIFGEHDRGIAVKNTVLCNLCRSPLTVNAHLPHTHRTVGFWAPFLPAEESTPGALCLPSALSFSAQNKAALLIDQIIATHTVHTKGPAALAGMFLQLLEELDRHTRKNPAVTPPKNRYYVKKAKEYIFDHISQPIFQREIAQYLGISPEYLCAVFKTTEGVPVMQFVNRIKLEQIRLTVERNRLTLAEASEQYGYSDPNYVSRLHKKYFGYNITEGVKE